MKQDIERTHSLLIHLIHAIGVNIGRLLPYARLSKGKSLGVSCRLIGVEVGLLLPALVLELWLWVKGKKHKALLTRGFFEMDGLPKVGTPLIPRPKPLDQPQMRAIKRQHQAYVLAQQTMLKHRNWEKLMLSTQAYLRELDRLAIYVPMTYHLSESLSWWSMLMREESYPPRWAISMIKGHLSFLTWSLQVVDFPIQEIHQQGIGFIIHDVPAIPIHAFPAKILPQPMECH